MRKEIILILLLSFHRYTLCICQDTNVTPQNYIGCTFSTGSSYPDVFEVSYERVIKLWKTTTGLKISFIPSYQYEPFLEIWENKNYKKQNLIVLEAAPYLYLGKKKEKDKRFFLKAGLTMIPFHLKYDRIVKFNLFWPSDTINAAIDKHKFLLGFTCGGGFQFPLFKTKRGRIGLGSRFAGFGKEPQVVMFMVTMGIGL